VTLGGEIQTNRNKIYPSSWARKPRSSRGPGVLQASLFILAGSPNDKPT